MSRMGTTGAPVSGFAAVDRWHRLRLLKASRHPVSINGYAKMSRNSRRLATLTSLARLKILVGAESRPVHAIMLKRQAAHWVRLRLC